MRVDGLFNTAWRKMKVNEIDSARRL